MACEEERHNVAQRTTEQHGEPADRRDPRTFDHSGTELGDESEALEQASEDGEEHQQARNEDPVSRGDRRRPDRRLEQRSEQQQVQ